MISMTISSDVLKKPAVKYPADTETGPPPEAARRNSSASTTFRYAMEGGNIP